MTTCDPCLRGAHYWCSNPSPWDGATDEHGIPLACCCDEAYHLGYFEEARPEVEREEA